MLVERTSVCSICGKYRTKGNHTKCSEARRKIYTEGSPIQKEQEASRKAEKLYNAKRSAVPYGCIPKKAGMFSKGTSGNVDG